MLVTKTSIPRRTVLRGLGAAVALPLLDSMVPAFAASRNLASHPARHFGVVYVPNGMAMKHWTPATEGAGFELSRILRPLEAYRDRMLVMTGLNALPSNAGVHASAATQFLTGVTPARRESSIRAGGSVDQLIARETGKHTQLASLELALDPNDQTGSCNVGLSCPYTSTISWQNETTPARMEDSPRAVFDRLFGDSRSTVKAPRLHQINRRRSILDAVIDKVSSLTHQVGPSDRQKIDQYLEAVRDAERRIGKAEEQRARELVILDQRAGVPATYEEHAKLMFDLQVLAHQADITRVTTLMMGRELSGRTYAEIGVPDAHHAISHHQNNPVQYEKVARINEFHTSLFSHYLDALQGTPDGDGSLLDHMMLLYGAGMSDSHLHDHTDLPLLMVGGGSPGPDSLNTGGRHLRFADETPAANIHLTLLDKMGVPAERMGG